MNTSFGHYGMPAAMLAPASYPMSSGFPSISFMPAHYGGAYSGAVGDCGCHSSMGDAEGLGDAEAFGAPLWSWAAGVVGIPATGGLSMILPFALSGARRECARLSQKYEKAKRRGVKGAAVRSLKARRDRACNRVVKKDARRATRGMRMPGPLALLGPKQPVGPLPPGDMVVPGGPGEPGGDVALDVDTDTSVEASGPNWLLWGGLGLAAVVAVALVAKK